MKTAEPKHLAIWQAFLDSTRKNVSSHVFETWIRPIRCLTIEDNVAITKDDPRILTDGLAREVDEIETLMAG